MSDDARDAPAAADPLPWQPLPPWHEAALAAALERRATWPHALLLHGPAGIGKEALALAFAQALLCEAPRADGRACGECPSCRYATAGQHPDLMRVTQVSFDDDGEPVTKETIGVDRIRDVTSFTQLTAHRQRAKVVVIAPAERMNANAANALLKTLEEPPAATYLMLVTAAPGRLPATIVSRCRKLPFGYPAAEAVLPWLAARGLADPALALAQAGGAPFAALAFADAGWQGERRAWLAALADPARLPVLATAARIDAGGKDARRARLAQALDLLLGWAADLARVSSGAPPRVHPDCAAALARLAPRVAPLPLFRYHRTLLRQRALLAHPLQPRLVAEAMLLDYRALFAPA